MSTLYENTEPSDREQYKNLLRALGALSNLYSDSEIPYLYYRGAEKVFCKSFQAEDLSRRDVSVDAKLNTL